MKTLLKMRKCAIILAAGGFIAAAGMINPLYSEASPATDYKVVRTGLKSDSNQTMYTIKRGDTFARIAKKMLGDGSRWPEIAAANPLVKAQNLQVGNRIIIPSEAFAGNAIDLPEAKVETQPAPETKSKPSFETDLSFIDSLLPCDEEVKEESESKRVKSSSVIPVNSPANSYFSGTEFELPENLKPEKASPYFVNARGFHGLFNTESAFYPPTRTLTAGFNLRYDKYAESTYGNFKLTGSQWRMPLNLLFLSNRLMAGITLPVQSWEVQRTDGTRPSVSMSGLHDPSVRLGYQIWHDFASEQAISLHFEARFPSGNYHQPMLDMTDKTRNAVQVGPAEATRGGWLQLGGAYSRRLTERWNSHFNLALASNPRDRMTRVTPTCALDYRLSDSCILQAEADAPSWSLENGADGTNLDVLFGVAWFTPRWQFSLGIPIAAGSNWGYEREMGVMIGMNYRQD